MLIFLCSLLLAEDNPQILLHACWSPDLTITSPPYQCVESGKVGGGVEFHLVAIYSSPITGFTCTGMLIEELTSDHPPQTITITNFQNFSTLGCCSSSPPPPGKTRVLFCTVPSQTFGFHNTKYRVTAYFSYRIQQPPGQQPPGQQPPPPVTGSTSIVIEFENLIVNANPKILKWDPDNPSNCDTTFSYTLSSAQKKNCQVTIDIYNLDAVYDNNGNPNPVFETTLNQLCPGTYTFTWDGTVNRTSYPPNNIAPTGLYTFDITVNGKTPNGLVLNDDKDRMRSEIITVSQTSLDIEEDKYKFGYYFQSSDGSLPSKAEVTVYGPAIDNFKNIGDQKKDL